MSDRMGNGNGTDQGNGQGGFWGFLSDLVGAAGDIYKTVAGQRKAGSGPTYVPQTGLDPGLVRIGVIALVALVAWRIFKGR